MHLTEHVGMVWKQGTLRLFIIWIVWLPFSHLVAQHNCDHQVQIQVLDEDESPVYSVFWSETNSFSGATDANGAFTFSNVCSGKFDITIHSMGYLGQNLKVQIKSDTTFVIVLLDDRSILDEVIIHEEELHRTSLTGLSMKAADVVAESGKSLAEMVSILPGVTSLRTGPNIDKPVIHGMSGYRISIIHDGSPLESQQWGQEHAPELEPYAASAVQILKGASAVQAGPGLVGGSIVIDSDYIPDQPGVGGLLFSDFHSNGRGGNVMANTALRSDNMKWVYQLTAGYKRFGDFQAPNYIMSNTGVSQQNVRGMVRYQNKRWIFKSSLSYFQADYGILRSAHLGNLTDLARQLESDEPLIQRPFTYEIQNPKQETAHLKGQAEITHIRASGQPVVFRYAYQQNERKEFDIRRGGRDNIPALDMKLTTHQFFFTYDHDLFPDLHGKVGVDASIRMNRNIAGTGVQPLIPFYNENRIGIYLIERYSKSSWEAEMGIRLDADFLEVRTFDESNDLIKPTYDFTAFSGNVGVRKRFNAGYTASLMFSTASRFMQVHELYSAGLHHGTGSIEEGLLVNPDTRAPNDAFNPEFSNETAWQFTATLAREWDKFNLDADVFTNVFKNYTYLRPANAALTVRGAFPVFRYVQIDSWFVGFDAGGDWQITDAVNWRLSGSYLAAKDVTNDEFMVQVPPASIRNRWQVRLPIGQKSSTKPMLSLTWDYVFKQTRVPETLPIEDLVDIALDPERDIPTSNFDFKDPPEAYHLLGLRLDQLIPINESVLKVSLGISNLLNHTYRDYMNRLRYITDEQGIDISLGITYSF